ncbi:MAG: alpha/beta hydrolase [Candidatus Eisenbacteria bacterium]
MTFRAFLLMLLAAVAASPAYAVMPSVRHAMQPAQTGLAFEEVRIVASRDSLPISGWWFEGAAGSPVLVMCSRGHGTMADLLPSVREFASRGFTVLTFDYRDFGPGSAGTVDSIQNVVFASRWVDDAEGAFQYSRTRAPGRFVFAWGQDLGGPVALAVANRDRRLLDALAVEGLFRTAQEVSYFNGTSQLPGVQQRHRRLVLGSDEPVSTVPMLQVPLFVVIAKKDTITPANVTQELARRSLSRIDRWILPEGGHNDLELTPGYFDRLSDWFKQLMKLLPTPSS